MKASIKDLWSWLTVLGFFIMLVGMFILSEASDYVKTNGELSIDSETGVPLIHYNVESKTASDTTHILTPSNDDLKYLHSQNLLDDIPVYYLPMNSKRATVSISGLQTAGYILISIGSAMVIAFMFTYVFGKGAGALTAVG
jgi:hypothetical protein